MSDPGNHVSAPVRRRRVLVTVIRAVVLVVLLFFVGRKLIELWASSAATLKQCHWSWLVAAAGCYLTGWVPAVWYWKRLLARAGSPVGWRLALKAYYCGHPGKYVPGKALAIAIRVSVLSSRVPMRIAVRTAILETLLVMGAGLLVGAALTPWVVAAEAPADWPAWLPAPQSLRIAGPCLAVAGLAAGAGLSRVVERFARQRLASTQSEPPMENSHTATGATFAARDYFAGVGAGSLSWWLHGLSCLCILHSIDALPLTAGAWLIATGATAAATSISFFVLIAPGGLGVREAVFFLLLVPHIGDVKSVAAAVLLRFIWLLAELLSAGVLVLVPAPPIEARDH